MCSSDLMGGCNQTSTPRNTNSELSTQWRDPEPASVSPSLPKPEIISPKIATSMLTSEQNNGMTSVGDSANVKIFEEAQDALNESSRNGPDGGNLACAWMVNKILERAVGFKVNGDSTTTMNRDFGRLVASGRAEEVPLTETQPGDVIISPTVWTPTRNTGHVGIVGENGSIFSNSSSNARWESNFTMNSWLNYYQQNKGLRTYAYRIVS